MDEEWHTATKEACQHQVGRQVRHLFVTLLLLCDIVDVRSLWDKNWRLMSDDIEYIHSQNSGIRNFTISKVELHSLILHDIDLQLRKAGKSLADFPTLFSLTYLHQYQSENTLLFEEYMFDRH